MWNKMPFIIRLFWDPIRALDLLDKSNAADFGKILPFLLMQQVLVLKAFKIEFTWYELLILAALTGGVSTVRVLIKSGVLKGTLSTVENITNSAIHNVQHTISEKIERTITERDHASGMQATVEKD
jgi:hypothetical protein